MTKRELINRWNSNDGKLLLDEVIDCLTRGKRLSTINGLEKHNQRWDLRGAVLSTIKKEQKIEAGGHGFIKKTGSLKVESLELESVDFSFSNISYSSWQGCIFKKCLFEETKAKEIRFVTCDIVDSVFLKSNLSYSHLNENIGSRSGAYLRCHFRETDLSESIFCFPVISECVFEDCKLIATNFDGSRLSNCAFLGEVNSPWFRGYSITANKSVLGIFNRVNVKDYPNKMENVNFSKAKLIGVSFSHDIDLKRCIFPQGDQYIYIENLKDTMMKAKAIIETDWSGEYKQKGLLLINNVYFKKDKYSQPNDFIDTYPIASSDIGFERIFFKLIKDCNSSQIKH